MLTSDFIELLKKLEPVSLDDLGNYRFMLFGNGGFAQRILDKHSERTCARIDYSCKVEQDNDGQNWIIPQQARGVIVLGSGNGSYQFNQLQALAEYGHDEIEKVLLVDPYLCIRNIDVATPSNTLLLLEHADGVNRHNRHLCNLKKILKNKGITTTSICPLTLLYYPHYMESRDIVIFNGQRDLYKVANTFLSHRITTYVEYGFFPQDQYFYMDKRGVNHRCSLMNDDLDWIEKNHIDRMLDVKKRFLCNFNHNSTDFILVPLQVPDDVNIVKCSRFTNGMQEFIDYIIDYYPDNKNIVFKAHPKDPHRHSYDYRGKKCSDLPFMTLLENAELVHGITSSTLYEAALSGVDIIVEGVSLLSRNKSQYQSLFAAMIDRQISVETNDFEYWLSRYSHIQHFG